VRLVVRSVRSRRRGAAYKLYPRVARKDIRRHAQAELVPSPEFARFKELAASLRERKTS
jgi:hypothetical protein